MVWKEYEKLKLPPMLELHYLQDTLPSLFIPSLFGN